MALNVVKKRLQVTYQSKISNLLTLGTDVNNYLNAGDIFQLVSNTSNPIFNTNLTVHSVGDSNRVKIDTPYTLRSTSDVFMEIPYYSHGDTGLQAAIPFKYGDMVFSHVGTGASSIIVGFSNDGLTITNAAAIQLSNIDATELLGVSVNWKYLHVNIVNIDANCKLYIQWEGE